METNTETTKSETKTTAADGAAKAKKAAAKASPIARRQRALAAKKAPKRVVAKPARKPRAAKWEGTTTSFVLQPEMAELSGPEIVALGKKVGLSFSAKYVYTLRHNAKAKKSGGSRSRTAKANGASSDRARSNGAGKLTLAANGDASKQLLRAAGELGWSAAIGLIEEHRAAMQV